MNKIERRLFSTDDWLSRHPKVIAVVLFMAYILVSSIQ
jgi:hypothetical protein